MRVTHPHRHTASVLVYFVTSAHFCVLGQERVHVVLVRRLYSELTNCVTGVCIAFLFLGVGKEVLILGIPIVKMQISSSFSGLRSKSFEMGDLSLRSKSFEVGDLS